MARVERIEDGDLFFFYRARVGLEKVRDLDDVGRSFFVMARRMGRRRRFRMFVIGRKRMPDIVEGEARREERAWALNVLTTDDPAELRRVLGPERYMTKTRGERSVAAATPAGEARYALLRHEDHTELAYVLELPAEPGPAQEMLNIRREAAYIVSVRNPHVKAPGIPEPSETPRYPPEIWERFGDRRWIDVDDPSILDVSYSQIVLIGARDRRVQEELGIRIPAEVEDERSAELFRVLRLRDVPREALFEGELPDHELHG